MIKKLVLPFILAVSSALIIIFIPPQNIVMIIAFILILSLFMYLVLAIFFGKKIGIVSSFLFFIFMLLNLFIGYSFLNTVLLASLLIALTILIK